MRDSAWGFPGFRRYAAVGSCWLPRTRLHHDEISAVAAELDGFDGAVINRDRGVIVWEWSRFQVGDGRYPARARLDGVAHFLLEVIFPVLPAPELDRLLSETDRLSRKLYQAILDRWPAIAFDVRRGVIGLGSAAALIHRSGVRTAHVRAVSTDMVLPDAHLDRTMPAAEIEHFLFVEAGRLYAYCAMERYREVFVEVRESRNLAVSEPVNRTERLSERFNARVEDIRAIRARFEMFIQVLNHRLATETGIPEHYRRELADLIMVAEHMYALWSMQEQNFQWLVDHITLRTSIAERATTRSFTTAVFTVALVGVIQNLTQYSLVTNAVTVTSYKVLVLLLGSASILAVSGLIYFAVHKIVK